MICYISFIACERQRREKGEGEAGDGMRQKAEAETKMRYLETKRKEGWHRGMSLFLHLLKLNIHTNYKAEMKSTGRLICFYPFKQWNYFLYDFFPVSSCPFRAMPSPFSLVFSPFPFQSHLALFLFLCFCLLLSSSSFLLLFSLVFFVLLLLSHVFPEHMNNMSTNRGKAFFFPDAPFPSPCGFDCCSSVRF